MLCCDAFCECCVATKYKHIHEGSTFPVKPSLHMTNAQEEKHLKIEEELYEF